MPTKSELKRQAKEIKKVAKEYGLQSNYFFVTTFERYETQLKVIENLKKEINKKETQPTVKKEYVKNRCNLYVNPLYSEYNKAVDSANKTVACLMKILKNFKEETDEAIKEKTEKDPLMAIINGDDFFE
jgi:hypothetical protein